MEEYVQQAVDLYKGVAKIDSLRLAAAPFVSEGSITDADEEAEGELAPNASRVLMKALCLARLARLDALKSI